MSDSLAPIGTFRSMSRDVWLSQQSWHLAETLEARDGTRIRLRIKANAYIFQSSALAEIFTREQGWRPLASYPAEIWQQDNSSLYVHPREFAEAVLQRAADVLLARSAEILI